MVFQSWLTVVVLSDNLWMDVHIGTELNATLQDKL